MTARSSWLKLTRISLAVLIAAAMLPLAGAGPALKDELAGKYARAVHKWDIAAAQKTLKELHQELGKRYSLLDLDAQTAFLAGDYETARKILAAAKKHTEFSKSLLTRLEKLRPVYSKFQQYDYPGMCLRVAKGADEIMVPYCATVLKQALALNSSELGVILKEPVIVEFFPTLESFAVASTLSMEDIKRTGVVAITKFNRLMLTTPRVYLQGYRWADTVSHELTHYLIIKKTGNAIPVWLHEGIAKWQEARWRGLKRKRGLCPTTASLLATAITEKKFIPFPKMHPSLAKLESQKDAMLAYAESVSFLDYFIRTSGAKRPVAELLDQVGGGKSVLQAFAIVSGSTFEKLEKGWRSELERNPPQVSPGIIFIPIKAARRKDNTAGSQVFERDIAADAKRYARLGDLLLESGRYEAAIKEYWKAGKNAGAQSPSVSIRLTGALIKTTRYEKAAETAEALLRHYPDYVEAHKLLALALLRMGRMKPAARSFREALHINPFDPEIHRYLAEIHKESGRTKQYISERAAADLLEDHAYSK